MIAAAFSKVLIAFAIGVMIATASPVLAQSDTTPAQQAPAASEGDHLSFMQPEPGTATDEPSSGSLLLKTIGAMLLVVGLIFFAAWGLKKLGFGGPKPTDVSSGIELNVVNTVSMGNGRSISTIRFGERLLLVGSTSDSFTLLAEENEEMLSAMPRARSVAEMLADESDSFQTQLLTRRHA